MNKTPAYYVFLGLLLGTIFGLGMGAASGNAFHGLQLGALAGLFIGWVIAANNLQQGKKYR